MYKEYFSKDNEIRRAEIINHWESLKLSDQFKKDLAKVREEVKEGKYSSYNNVQELLDELDL